MKSKLLIVFALLNSHTFSQIKKIERPDYKYISTIQIDHIIKKLMDTAEVTGLQIGIINNNKISYLKSYGYKNKSKDQLNDTATIFYAASLSKPLFAYLVMMLKDEKKIDLDKPLYQYLPKPLSEYENYKDLAGDDRWKLITARNCLDHTTGFPNWRQFNPHDNQKLEIFFTPGSRYAYSGEGITLLQMVIEIITGRGLEELCREKIFAPFGMNRTSFIWQSSFENNYAIGYDMNGDPLQKNKRTKAYAAGSMETTIGDYSRFIMGVMSGRGISESTKQDMVTKQIEIKTIRQFPSLNNDSTISNKKIDLSYGLGWGLFLTPYGNAFFKEGHDDGWVHYMISVPGKKYAIIFLCNSSNGESIYKELVEKLAGIDIPYIWENYIPYRATIKLSEEYLKQFTGEYDGKMKAKISLNNGKLKAESSTTGLPPTNLYATNDHHFFLKIMDVELEFIKGNNGKIEKLLVNDEGDTFELKKIK